MSTQLDRDEILKKAYEIWEAEGCPEGRDMEHWFKAELMIVEERSKNKRKASGKKSSASAKSPAKEKAAAKPKKKSTAKKAASKKSSGKSKP